MDSYGLAQFLCIYKNSVFFKKIQIVFIGFKGIGYERIERTCVDKYGKTREVGVSTLPLNFKSTRGNRKSFRTEFTGWRVLARDLFLYARSPLPPSRLQMRKSTQSGHLLRKRTLCKLLCQRRHLQSIPHCGYTRYTETVKCYPWLIRCAETNFPRVSNLPFRH